MTKERGSITDYSRDQTYDHQLVRELDPRWSGSLLTILILVFKQNLLQHNGTQCYPYPVFHALLIEVKAPSETTFSI